MASAKSGALIFVGSLVVVLIILLNFDILPKRRLSEELEFSTKAEYKGSLIPSAGYSSVPTTQAVTSKNNDEKVPVAQYVKNLMTWNCTEDHSNMDNEPELSYEDVKNFNFSWNCSGYPQTPEDMEDNATKSMCYKDDAPFICVRDPLHCNHKDKSDMRFLRRPQYGEYKYLPKSLWLNVALHGGIAFLYHPCARQDLKEKLRAMAVSCLQRHVITPYERLSPCKPIAMVAWGCWYAASQVNVSEGKQWIQDNAMKAVASHVLESGEYKDGLIANAVTVSDRHDSLLCPNKFNSRLPSNLPKQQSHHLVEPQDHSTDDTEWLTNRGESISIQNSEQVLIVNEQVSTANKVDPYNAAWALGSVIFLCLILGGVLFYTRLWKNRDHWWRAEDYNSNTKFSLMKNRGLRWKPRTFSSKRTSGYSRLLTDIPEEFDDDI
ncbi:uncharacterized protein LOC114967652 [Acropora millepora]|uniref:uncharacterized protein LOC114967652 n=1 Tax=Acropora millepora TaxID=45264 RepID=UPI001CF3785F|nr:uncharacterized protein LOC114967652 [Acropora millepora]